MSGRQKRSSGGYDLRRKVAKKRWDEDFEYYFSKIGAPIDTSIHKFATEGEKTENHDEVMLFGETEKQCNVNRSKNNTIQSKRPRGRPRKVQVLDLDMNIIVSDTSVAETEFREEIIGCSKEFPDSNNIDEERCKDQVILPLSAAVTCSEDHVGKHLKLAAILSPEQLTCLQEEEVCSAPEMEKENLEGNHTHTDSGNETMMLQMTGRLVEIDEIEKRLISQKVKRRYRRSQLTEETIQKLSQLSSDDKIECDECHKLLKPSSFRQHLRTHSGVKPFGCDMCPAKFTRKGDVERHVRIVHNKQKPFKCSKCHRCFGDKKNLRWHLMNHDKRLFYVCEVCGFKFGKREYWENHVRIIHPNADQKSEKCVQDNNAGDDEDDRVQTLADSFLAESEGSVDDPVEESFCTESTEHSYNQGQELFTKIDRTDAVATLNIENGKLPPNPINIVSDVGHVSSTKDGGIFFSNEHLSDSDVMGTVVIQLDGNDVDAQTLESIKTIKKEPMNRQNIFHINSSDVLELVQGGSVGQQDTYTINEHSYDESDVEKVIVSVGGEGVRAIEYVDDVCDTGSKVYGVMLTDELEKGNNVQNFVEALFAAMGNGSRKQAAVEAS